MNYNEYKYVIELDRVPYAVALLESLYGNTDPYPHGTVNSLYYDSLSLAMYEQCVGGNEFKAKYRVRWYDGGHKSKTKICMALGSSRPGCRTSQTQQLRTFQRTGTCCR